MTQEKSEFKLNYKFFIKLLEGRTPKDIVSCAPHDLDIDRWMVVVTTKDGFETRLSASSQEEAESFCRQILFWRDNPSITPSISYPWKNIQNWIGFSFLVVFISLPILAWYGMRNYWLVHGWVYTNHFWGGLGISVGLFTLFFWWVNPKKFTLNYYLLGLPFLIILTVLVTAAGKTINAAFGRQDVVAVNGRVLDLRDSSMTLYFPRGKNGSTAGRPIRQCEILVEDRLTRKTYWIDVPGWVADREKLTTGAFWEDRFYRGSLGWFYRRGNHWDGFDFVPKAASWAPQTSLPSEQQQNKPLIDSLKELKGILH